MGESFRAGQQRIQPLVLRWAERTDRWTEEKDVRDWSGDVKEIGQVRKGNIVDRHKCTEETTTHLRTYGDL